jgi:hypothetical protein
VLVSKQCTGRVKWSVLVDVMQYTGGCCMQGVMRASVCYMRVSEFTVGCDMLGGYALYFCYDLIKCGRFRNFGCDL